MWAAYSRCLRSSDTLVVRADGNAIEVHLVLLQVKLHAALPQRDRRTRRGLFHGKVLAVHHELKLHGHRVVACEAAGAKLVSTQVDCAEEAGQAQVAERVGPDVP